MSNSQFLIEQRKLRITLDGKGPYIITKLYCEEQISSGFSLTTTIISEAQLEGNILGKIATVTYENGTKKRFFQNFITSFKLVEFSNEKNIYYYEIEVKDPLAILEFSYNRQIFHKMSTINIIKKLLDDSGFKSYFKFCVTGEGRQYEYCVQMDETNLNFIQRLLSCEGWHYRFDHSGSKPLVIIADSNQSFTRAEKNTLYFKESEGDTEVVVTKWCQLNRLGINKLSLAEYSRDLAQVFESGERKSVRSDASLNLHHYMFGQGIEDKGALRELAKHQMEAIDVQKVVYQSTSSLAELGCGVKFKLAKHPVTEINQEYVITGICHWIESGESGRQANYTNQFTCLPASIVFRPPRIAKPIVQSIHSAIVTGPKNEEIYKDKQGRIKVRFYWDQNSNNDENSSCWLPVSQGMASKGFGIQFIPRVGDEVLVQYIDGDPDRPVVVGSLYNKINQAPYSVATQSGIKTCTMPKESNQQGNELRFEDQRGKEHVFLHAEKDMLLEINNDYISSIKGNMLSCIDQMAEFKTKENFTIHTDKDLTTSSNGCFRTTADKNIFFKTSSSLDLEASSEVNIDGNKISISGKSKIELRVGSSKIEISASGIKLDAAQISLNGQSKFEVNAAIVNIEGHGKIDIKSAIVTLDGSAMTDIKAGAMVQIQGAITKVN